MGVEMAGVSNSRLSANLDRLAGVAGRYFFIAFVAIACLYLLAPILVLFVTAFNPTEYMTFPPQGFTLRWFSQILGNRDILDAFWLSLRIAILAAVISTVAATAAGIALTRFKFLGIMLLRVFLLSPLLVPGVVFGIALLIFLSRYGYVGTFAAILGAHICVAMPYAVRAILAGLDGYDASIEDAARALGASRLTVLFTITLPLIRTSVFSAAVFAFLISFDEAVVTLFISSAGGVTLPVFIFQYVQYNNDPLMAAVAVCMIFINITAVILTTKRLKIV